MLELAPDVICLQEIHSDKALERLRSGLADQYTCVTHADTYMCWGRAGAEAAVWILLLRLWCGLEMLQCPYWMGCLMTIALACLFQYVKSGVTWCFMLDDATGLVCFYKKDRFRVREWERVSFE